MSWSNFLICDYIRADADMQKSVNLSRTLLQFRGFLVYSEPRLAHT